ncbi:MAG: hypothetical protein ACLUOI_19225 [Eisenbergiella sp.]
MGDSTMNFHWVDNDALTVEKTVTEKAGDITKAGSGATLDDHIAQANNLMEEQAKSAHSAREQEENKEKHQKCRDLRHGNRTLQIEWNRKRRKMPQRKGAA